MRRLVIAATFALLAAACWHDNASPFVHGAKNDPRSMGGSMVSAKTNRPPEGNPANSTH